MPPVTYDKAYFDGEIDKLVDKMHAYDPKVDGKTVHDAFDYALNMHGVQLRESGEPYVVHPLKVAEILAEMEMDQTTIVAALLHDCIEDTRASYETIEQRFGADVARLVDGVTKLDGIEFRSKDEQKAESLRKMFFAMAKDIRVVIIKLADRLHNMRTLKFCNEQKRVRTAQETIEVYAPLANRLGINSIKWELEDLCLRYLDPESFYDLVDRVNMKREERLQAIDRIIEKLRKAVDEAGIPAAFEQCSREGGASVARAIMTTDTRPKEYAVTYESGVLEYVGCTFTVGGCVKGSGMIMPNMATMIALITTDAPVEPETLHRMLAACVNETFNKVTVDSDTSTNDTCILLASGAAAPDCEPICEGSEAYEELAYALKVVCESLARAIAADGEGASRLITVNVTGAPSDEDADTAARAVANSPLVKTAVAGHDCNWGRIAMALGKCGVVFDQQDVSIDIMGMPVCRDGLTVPFDEDEALRRFEASEIVLEADLGAGSAETTIWTCDFSHEYVSINGDYRS